MGLSRTDAALVCSVEFVANRSSGRADVWAAALSDSVSGGNLSIAIFAVCPFCVDVCTFGYGVGCASSNALAGI